ncbi:MAG: hypothetical protein GC201_13260 [Alphaproteobacteria bacterium]|nr:hypothetical protein [Alphaproteobacteria bacterium]
MTNWTMKTMTAGFIAAVLLTPLAARAVTLSAYEQADSDPAKQTQIFKDAYTTAIGRTLAGLRDEKFTDGKQKTPQRIVRDRKLADIVDGMVAHLTKDQSESLTVMIDQYAQAQPTTELEDVIESFLLTEAKKKMASG